MFNLKNLFTGSPAESAPPSRKEPTMNVSNALSDNDTIMSTNLDAMAELFGLPRSAAGSIVNAKTSLKVSVVFRCVSLIAGALAQMPVHIYIRSGEERQRDTQTPLNDLLNLQPTPIWSAATFWEYIASSMLLHGDGFAVILRNHMGEPVEVLPISPLLTQVDRVDGRNVYYTDVNGQPRGFDQDDILHFPGFGFNGLRSLSVIQWGALNSIGLEIAMQEHAGEFFRSGTTQRVAITKTGRWDEDQKDSFRKNWVKTYGGVSNSGLPLVLDQTANIKELSINAKDAQLLESREFQITDVARAFGLPSWMVNQEQKSTSWGSGMAEIGLGFLRYTIGPHLNRYEQELNRKLFFKTPRYCEFNTASLMRVTQKERYEAYSTALGGPNQPGFLSVNEVRKYENLPPWPEDIYNKGYFLMTNNNGAETSS